MEDDGDGEDDDNEGTGYVEGHSYKEASVLTLGQKTGLFQFSGPGQAQKLLYKNDPQCILPLEYCI